MTERRKLDFQGFSAKEVGAVVKIKRNGGCDERTEKCESNGCDMRGRQDNNSDVERMFELMLDENRRTVRC